MELPEDRGTYILISQVVQLRHLKIGCLGEFDIMPEFYAYMGSAFGSGGLPARLGHHFESPAELHWHIDYLLQVATPVEVWFTKAGRKLEHRHASKQHFTVASLEEDAGEPRADANLAPSGHSGAGAGIFRQMVRILKRPSQSAGRSAPAPGCRKSSRLPSTLRDGIQWSCR